MFFDNLQVIHTRGSILEESHYYPFGLVMAGISNKAAGGLENKHKFNGIEFNSVFDINMYDAFYRNLDPQIGRFWQIDPKLEGSDGWSPYTAMLDNPIKYMDQLGDSGVVPLSGKGVPPLPIPKIDGISQGLTPHLLINELTFTPIHSTQSGSTVDWDGLNLTSSQGGGSDTQKKPVSTSSKTVEVNVDLISIGTNSFSPPSNMSESFFGMGQAIITEGARTDNPKNNVKPDTKDSYPHPGIKPGTIVNFGSTNSKKINDSTWETITKPATDTSPIYKKGYSLF